MPPGTRPDPRPDTGSRPWLFFMLTFTLAVPFWVLGAIVNANLLPRLPIAAFDFLCPGLAAFILMYHDDGSAAAVTLLKRSLDFKRVRVKAWYAPTLLLMPLIMAVSFGVMRLTFRPAGFIPTQLSKGEPTSDRPAGGRVQAPRLGRDCGYLP